MTKLVLGPFRMIRHAAQAARRRGIREQAIDLVLAIHDRTVHVGNGREAWSVSRVRCGALRAAGLPGAVVERLGRTILVIEPLTAEIVTVINGHADGHRRYRRGDDGRPRYGWKAAA
jgi:hypothetical protein